MPRVTFEYGPKPALNALAYLQRRLPGLTRLEAFKLLYLADRHHLEIYGRPITGDRYAAMEKGPVPSRTYDFVKKRAGDGWRLPDLNDPDLEAFSDSEQEVLDEVVDKYGRYTARELINITHDKVWKDTWGEAEAAGKGSEPIPWERIIQSLKNGDDIFRALLND